MVLVPRLTKLMFFSLRFAITVTNSFAQLNVPRNTNFEQHFVTEKNDALFCTYTEGTTVYQKNEVFRE